MKIHLRPRIVQKKAFIVTSVFIMLISVSTIFYFQFGKVDKAKAAANGDYRSAASGNWNVVSSWEKHNGTSWAPAVATPTSADGEITIQNGHTITVSTNVTVDQVIVDAGGILTVAASKSLTIANGTGTDLMVRGALNLNGTLSQNASTAFVTTGGTATLASGGSHSIGGGGATSTISSGGRYVRNDPTMTTSSGIWTIDSGGVFQQNINGDELPQATWNTYSSCELTGVTNSKPNNLTQSFYHFTWNSSSQSSTENLQGELSTVNGDFNFISSGSGSVRLGQPENYNMTVGGNFNMQGGSLYECTKSTSCVINITGNYVQTGGVFGGTDISLTGEKALGTPTMNVAGNFNISGGTFDMTQNTGTAAGNGIMTLNLSGNLNQTGGTITETATTTATYGYGRINFAKTGTQNFNKSSGTISNTIHYTVNSAAILELGTNYTTGSGNFTVSSGAGLNIGSPNGITQSDASGNVQVSGTRSFSTDADYTYNGSSAQSTGNGLPSTVRNLTINNNSGATLTSSTSVSNTLTLTNGKLTTSNDTLTIGTSTAVTGTISRTNGTISGAVKRWIAPSVTPNILFPISTATDYKGANFSFTTAPTTGGTMTVSFNPANLSTNGSNFYDAPDSIQTLGNGYWATSVANGLAGGTFSVDLTATNLFGVSNFNSLHLVMRPTGGSAWTKQGTHVAATGSNAIPVVHRTGMTTLGHFGIGSPSGSNILPIELMFFNAKMNGRQVDLTWATASELNSDYFTVERSPDGTTFKDIIVKPAAGNSTVILNYLAIDENPLSGTSYYRLKETDNNGQFFYSAIKLVSNSAEPENETAIEITSVVPNPFKDRFKVSFQAKSIGITKFQLVNASGKVVFEDEIHTSEGVNEYEFTNRMNDIENGFYLINMILNGDASAKKIVKQ